MSKPIIVDVPHQLGKAEAQKRLREGFGKIREQVGATGITVQERWEGERLLFKAGALGQNLTGYVEVFEEHIRVEVELPWILAAIAGPLRERLRKEGSLLLEAKSRST